MLNFINAILSVVGLVILGCCHSNVGYNIYTTAVMTLFGSLLVVNIVDGIVKIANEEEKIKKRKLKNAKKRTK